MIGKMSTMGLALGIMALGLSGCAASPLQGKPAAGAPTAPAALRPGDEIDALALTTGGATVASLWEICWSAIGTSGDCNVAAGAPLAIGPNTLVMADGGGLPNWGHQQWQLYLDNTLIDLPAFGTFDFIRPGKGGNGQSEVFGRYRAWDVVVTALTGHHTLRGALQYSRGIGGSLAAPGRAACQWEVSFRAVSPYRVS